jgi:hypothetical protein
MAATRDKNSLENYQLEELYIKKQNDYILYENSVRAYKTYLPGDGLLTGKVAPKELSRNSCDIESFLYGIGTGNLVEPQKPPEGELYHISSLNIVSSKQKNYAAKELEFYSNPRPMFK